MWQSTRRCSRRLQRRCNGRGFCWSRRARGERGRRGGRRSCPRLPPLDPRVPLTLLAPGSLDVLLRAPYIWRSCSVSWCCLLLCYVWRHGPDSAVHCLAVPQLQFITVVDTPSRCAVAVPHPHGPVCSENHRDSPVRIWWSMSLFAGFPQVQSWMDCSDSQLQPLTLGLGVQACKFHRCGL